MPDPVLAALKQVRADIQAGRRLDRWAPVLLAAIEEVLDMTESVSTVSVGGDQFVLGWVLDPARIRKVILAKLTDSGDSPTAAR